VIYTMVQCRASSLHLNDIIFSLSHDRLLRPRRVRHRWPMEWTDHSRIAYVVTIIARP